MRLTVDTEKRELIIMESSIEELLDFVKFPGNANLESYSIVSYVNQLPITYTYTGGNYDAEDILLFSKFKI